MRERSPMGTRGPVGNIRAGFTRELRELAAEQRLGGRKVSVAFRIAHVGEHEVLPQQDAAGVAQIEEGVAFVNHGAADTQHVHASRENLPEGGLQLLRGSFSGGVEADRIRRCPARTAAENRHTVQVHCEVPTLSIQGNRAKPYTSELNG